VGKHRLILAVACAGFQISAQQRVMTPLGVRTIAHEPILASRGLRAILPKNAAVRLDTKTTIAADGEEIVVYDSGNEFDPEPHLVVVRSGHQTADFSLAQVFPQDGCSEICTLIASSEFEIVKGKRAFIVAFTNTGDGSGILFGILSEQGQKYEFIWKRETYQGRVKVTGDGKMQVWDADNDGECVWCPEHYKVTNLAWTNNEMQAVSHYTTSRALDPGPISDPPIVISK
jgi:hypothetical protein